MATETYIAAIAAALVVSGCASGEAALREDVSSLRSEVRTLQRENADLAKRVESLNGQVDVLSARLARGSPAPGAEAAPVAATPRAQRAPASADAAPVVPPNLQVVTLEDAAQPAAGTKAAKGTKGKSAAPARSSKAAKPSPGAKAPPVPTETPIQEPDAASLAALSGAPRPRAANAQASLEAAQGLSGLARARALEQFVDASPGHARCGDALLEAARLRDVAGDPDGSCEDLARAVAEYPGARTAADAIEGLAACEQHRGRTAEARRLQARLARDFPDSPAGKRARELAPAAQGAAP